MFRDLLEITQIAIKRVITSRLFALAVIFCLMFAVLIGRLFDLQIVRGEEFMTQYESKILRTVYTTGTRGNIYDHNGVLLARNELAYSVTIQDIGAYNSHQTRNLMLWHLIQILDRHGESIEGKLEIALDQDGEFFYTTSSEAARLRFLRDFYGLRSVEQLDDEAGKYPSAITARELFEKVKARFELDQFKDGVGNPRILTDDEALKIGNIRYAMSLVSYTSYKTTTVSSDVSEETVADILEHTPELQGVNIAESTIRVYEDALYFAPVIGYTGKVQSEEQLEELRRIDENYELNDTVGRIGIESTMEHELQGKKGVTNMYVDSVGHVLKVLDDATEPEAGHDIYLTLDRDLQIGIYHLLEQHLAGILTTNHLVNRDVTEAENRDSSKKKIPIKDAYYQLINNNVLSLSAMEKEDAGSIEKEIYSKFAASRQQILSNMREQLMSPGALSMGELPEDMKAYMQYVYSYLASSTVEIVQRDKIDGTSPQAVAWQEETISLRDYLYYGISESWVDTTKLEMENRYSNADDSFRALVDHVIRQLESDTAFTKRIYRYLINQDIVTGRELCLALYSQGILEYDEEEISLLTSGGTDYAFTFMMKKISNLEITPAQLALDPCTAGCTVTDVRTGEVRALVTYPSYNNNLMSGTVDAAYFSQLNNDLSLPLYNNATQVVKAPGSTFKPIAAIAGLEEQVIDTVDKIKCTGIYEEVFPVIRCWINPGYHGDLDVSGAIENSCNYFFSEVAHRLSTNEEGVYSTDRGLEQIRKYASMFGLDRPSGIEIAESSPQLTTEDPERSAMGQGNNAYTNVQLSRYVTALANRGTVFELSLIDKITESDGTIVEDNVPEVSNHVNIADSTWDAVQSGMRRVVTNSSAKNIFRDLEVEIAGKTGTAQENTRANHAFFISYGPYASPEISVTVNIPYGYASSNAAAVAKSVYRLYYGYTDLEEIINTGALAATNVVIGD
ncbi:MAG: penicillin-binding protein [Hungatella sp.]|nr:penicillin-binding protein [Hungatella sp.]